MEKELFDRIEKVNENFIDNEEIGKEEINNFLKDVENFDNFLFRQIKSICKEKNLHSLICNLIKLVDYFEGFSSLNTFRKNNKPVALWTNNADEGMFDNKDYANIANIDSISYMWDIIILCSHINKINNKTNDLWKKFENNNVAIAHVATIVFIKSVPSKQLRTIKVFTCGKNCKDIKLESALAMYELPILYKRLKNEQKQFFKDIKDTKLNITTSSLSENYNDPIPLKPKTIYYKDFVKSDSEELAASIIDKNKNFKKNLKKNIETYRSM